MIFLCIFLLIVAYQYIKILCGGLDGKGGVHWYDYVIVAPAVAVVWSMILIICYIAYVAYYLRGLYVRIKKTI